MVLVKSLAEAVLISMAVFVVLLGIGFKGPFFASFVVFIMAFLELFGARW